MQLFILLFVSYVSVGYSFHILTRARHVKPTTSRLMVEKEPSGEVYYDSIVLTGFLSKAENFAEPIVFTKLFERSKYKTITAVSDDIIFAKKRLVNPKNVYSGLIDVIEYSQANPSNYEAVLENKDAWLAFNIQSKDLVDFANLAVKSKLQRVVFAVNLTESEASQEELTFEDARSILTNGDVKYTIIKFGKVRALAEAKQPYRIVRGVKPVPNETPLSDQDLMRVLTETIDIPKTFDNVYGIGGGTRLDTEVLVYMKSQGWPERVQVGILMGDMMEKIEKKWEEEQKNRDKIVPAAPLSKPVPI